MRTSNRNRFACGISKRIFGKCVVVILSMFFALAWVTTLFIVDAYADTEPDVDAGAEIVFAASTGEVVYGEHTDRKLHAGFFVKLMNAVTVMDQMHDDSELDNVVTISEKADDLGDLFQKGDKISVKDLLYATLVENSDEAAYALAVYTSGNRDDFLSAMNAKALEWDLTDTRYMTVTGKYQTQQYTTASDAAILVRYVMQQYPVLREALVKTSYTTSAQENTRKQSFQTQGEIKYVGLEAFREESFQNPKKGTNAFAVVNQDGMELVSVILSDTSDNVGADAVKLLNYGYQHVTKQVIVKSGKYSGKIRIRHGSRTRVPVYTEAKGYVYIPKEGSDSLIRTQTVIYDHLTAPVKAGTKAGEFQIYVADELTGTVDLIVRDDVRTGWLPSYLYISNRATIIILAVLLVIFFIVLRIRALRLRKKRLAKRRRQEKIREMARKQYEIEEDRRKRNWTYR